MSPETQKPLDLHDLSDITGYSINGLSVRVRSGDIKAKIGKAKDSRHYTYAINIDDFGDFLCKDGPYRKRFVRRYRECGALPPDVQSKMRYLMEYLKTHPCWYSCTDLATIFCVDPSTINVWTNKGHLKKDAGRFYYSEESVKNAIEHSYVGQFIPVNYKERGLFGLYLDRFAD